MRFSNQQRQMAATAIAAALIALFGEHFIKPKVNSGMRATRRRIP